MHRYACACVERRYAVGIEGKEKCLILLLYFINFQICKQSRYAKAHVPHCIVSACVFVYARVRWGKEACEGSLVLCLNRATGACTHLLRAHTLAKKH